MDEIFEFFQNSNYSYEIIVVNDGSRDKTSDIVLSYVDQYSADKIKLMELSRNRGKGGAVRKGCLSAHGEYILFCDADGATQFSDLEKMYQKISQSKNSKYGKVVVGSRAHLETESIAERTLLRTILMKGFHLMVKYVGNVRTIQDTQCGFKLFTAEAAQFLFSNLHIERWAFDVELLYAAEKHQISVGEVAVKWQEIEGSKLTPLTAALQMARDLFRLRLYYIFGIYKFYYEQKIRN